VPPKKICGGIKNFLPAGPLMLVCHSSYEPRAEAISRLDFESVDLQAVGILATSETLMLKDYAERTERLITFFTSIAKTKVELISAERMNRISWIQQLHKLLEAAIVAGIKNVLVDISAFPRDRMWCVLDCIRRTNSIIGIFILYTEPGRYDSESGNDGWLTRGVRSISPIPGFNGYQNTKRQTLLVLIVGHEYERAHITIKNSEPQKVVLIGQGAEQYREGSPRLSDTIIEQIGNEYDSIVDLTHATFINSRDYIQTRDKINEVIQQYGGNFNIVVATYGTKLQSLGAMLACQANRSVRAIYAEPQSYNVSGYSTGAGNSWILQI